MRGVLLALCGWGAVGCGSAAPAPEHFYRLHLPAAAATASRPAPRFRLAALHVSPALIGDRLQVAASAVRTEPYVTHRWAAPLELLLEETASRGLAAAAGNDPALPALVLRVHEFFQVEGPEVWSGSVALTAELLRDGSVLWREEFTAVEPASTRHPEAVVAALSQAWAKVLDGVAARAAR